MLKKFVLLISVVLSFNGFLVKTEAKENKIVILATTTSVQDSGLLDVLVERFNRKSSYQVKAIAVGSGQALQMGRQGEADILWVHSPEDEKKFIADGYGFNRTTFMHNGFVLLGPPNDPAGIKDIKKVSEAFQKIVQSKALFVSRGDKSGTHKKELAIWKTAGTMPEKNNYLEVGQGMAATLRVANEKRAYCLADRSTYLCLRKSLNLVVVFQGDQALLNHYSLILVNQQKFSKVNAPGAKAFFDFLLSPEAKNIIDDFGKKKFGEQLFFYDYKIN